MKEALIKNSFIGTHITIIEYKKQKINKPAAIIDETKKTFIVKQDNTKKTYLKKDMVIEILSDAQTVRIQGELLLGRPEERIKR